MNHTIRRRVLPALALVLALTAAIVAWPAATVADPVPGGGDPTCQGQCSIDGLACSIDCWERYRWEPDLVYACQLACEQAIDVCAAACP